MSNGDHFSDLLVGDEKVYVIASGPGHPDGKQAVWWQVALTQYRVLAARMAPHGVTWRVVDRQALQRSQVTLGQFPRTPTSQARLELRGFPQPVSLLDIDRADLHANVQLFVQFWGQPVEGVGAVAVAHEAPMPEEGGNPDRSKLMLLAATCLGILILCCGCGSALTIVRELVARYAG